MNRFFDIPSIPSRELLPWTSRRFGLCDTTGLFVLDADLRFESDIAGGVIVVPRGFESDLASIPGACAWFMDCDDQRIAAGAWVHDYLYRRGGVFTVENGKRLTILDRAECDQILCFEAMPELGASRFQQQAVYRALRLFGGPSFRGGSRANIPDPTHLPEGAHA